jgi:poly(A) polymerase
VEAYLLDTQTLHLLHQTTQYFTDHHQPAYLVGGSLRNILLGEPCTDWDIVTTGDAHQLARRLADKLGGHYVHLHEKASRVIVASNAGIPNNKKEITLDISPLNDKTLEDDLRQRDFTINAIAAPLDQVVQYLEVENTEQPQPGQPSIVGATLAVALGGGPVQGTEPVQSPGPIQSPGPAQLALARHLIDPLHGLSDLESHRLKAVNEDIFRHDPLRMLRAIRLMMRYQLQLDPWTESLMIRDAALLPQVAAERIHEELYAILGPAGATGRLRFLDQHGLFTIIFPEFVAARGMRQPSPHYWDVLEHSLESVGALERLASMLQEDTQSTGRQDDLAEIRALLREAEQQGIFSFAGLTAPRMKMAALLHDIGKPVTYSSDEHGGIHFYNHPQAGVPLVEQVMRRLCASTQDRRLAQLVAAHHMRPGQLGQNGPLTPRAIRRYFVDLGPTGIYVALISLADHLATLGPQPTTGSWERHLRVVRLLLTSYIRERERILPPRLISPEELMRRLKLEPGPQIGQLLDLIAEAQAEGTIHSKEEALWLAEERVHEMTS